MADSVLAEILDRITDAGLVDDPVIEDDVVRASARLEGAGVEVEVELDPEIEDVDDPDVDALVEALADVLDVSETQWRAIIEEIAVEIEDAIDDDELSDKVDLRVDLEAVGVVVFADAVVIVFTADTQFPESLVHVQLGPDFEVEDIEIVTDDDDEEEDEDESDDEERADDSDEN